MGLPVLSSHGDDVFDMSAGDGGDASAIAEDDLVAVVQVRGGVARHDDIVSVALPAALDYVHSPAVYVDEILTVVAAAGWAVAHSPWPGASAAE